MQGILRLPFVNSSRPSAVNEASRLLKDDDAEPAQLLSNQEIQNLLKANKFPPLPSI
jgi:hypothetical protein